MSLTVAFGVNDLIVSTSKSAFGQPTFSVQFVLQFWMDEVLCLLRKVTSEAPANMAVIFVMLDHFIGVFIGSVTALLT